MGLADVLRRGRGKTKNAQQEVTDQTTSEQQSAATATETVEQPVAADTALAQAINPALAAQSGSRMESTDGRSTSLVPVGNRSRAGRRKRGLDPSFAAVDAAVEKLNSARAKEASQEGIIDVSKLSRAERKALRSAMGDTLDLYPHLMAIKPKEGYLFHSDYFDVDDRVACVLSYFHKDEARDDFPVFWGINRIPTGLGPGVSTIAFEQVERMSEKWVDDKLKTADKMDKLESREQSEGGTASTMRRAAKVAVDMEVIVDEIQNGASYLNIHNRLLIHAPSLEGLDTALERLKRLYIDRMATISAEPYHGEQRDELTNLLAPNKNKRGEGAHLTSTEFAGSYSLVTNGLNDPSGEYVGSMQGDVNNSAILFDVDRWDKRIVGADEAVNPIVDARVCDMWASKVSQAALLNNHRVVHLVLNDADLDRLGPPLDRLTARLDMTSGDVNMFELFGDVDRELSLFPTHLEKLVLMTEQAYGNDENEAMSIIRGKLREILTEFYITQGMWVKNAKYNRNRLRLVGLPHKDVPLLQLFVTYLDSEHERLVNAEKSDDEEQHAVTVLKQVFRHLLDNNGDLFNQHTASAIDAMSTARRVIYDFSGLVRRGYGIAMAQLVNVVGFAVETLGRGDVVIIHGADSIRDERVQNYLANQFDHLERRGGRVAYFYEKIDRMIETERFNLFPRAHYTLFGPMSNESVTDYEVAMSQYIPRDLRRKVTQVGSGLTYLRRGTTNVVFQTDMALGINPARGHRRVSRTPSGSGAMSSSAVEAIRAGGGTGAATAVDDGSARSRHRGGGTNAHDVISGTATSAQLEAEQADRDVKAAEREAERARVAQAQKDDADIAARTTMAARGSTSAARRELGRRSVAPRRSL